MKNIGAKQLETERLILRRGTIEDAEEIYNNIGKDSLVSKYVLWNQYTSVDDGISFMKRWEESYENDNSYKWLIVLKKSNEIIGTITAVKADEKNKTVEIGYSLGSKWWNNGYTTEATKAVIKFFFETVGVETVYAGHLEVNMASGKVLLKSGMKKEGIMRNRIIDKATGKPMNLITYSIIKEEFFK